MLPILCWIFLSFCCCLSMIEKNTVSIGHEVRTLHQFKYANGGSLEMNIETEGEKTKSTSRRVLSENENIKSLHTLRLYHCTDKELEEIRSYRTVSAFCEQIESFSCVWNGYINDDSQLATEYKFSSTKTQTLTVLAVNCDESGYKYRAQYHLTAKNGNSEYLSLSEIPYKQIYIFLGVVWGICSVVWIVHWYRYKYFNIAYQRMASFYPILKAFSCIMWHLFWVYCSKKGVESSNLSFAVKLTDSLADGWLFLSLILMVEGWNWLRNGLEGRRQYAEVGLWFLLFVGSTVASYYCISMAIVVAFALVLGLYRILSCWMFNMRDLKGQKELLEMEYPQMVEDKNAPINIKISMFQSLQTAVGGFLLAHIVLQFLDPLFVESPWANTLIVHFIFIAFVCFLGYCIRMRPFRPGFNVMEYNNDGAAITQFPEMWHPGMPVPLVPKNANYGEWLQMSEREVIILTTEMNTDAKKAPIETFSLLSPLSYDMMTKTYHPHQDKQNNEYIKPNNNTLFRQVESVL